nr:MAG TPA: hypothetical protein [Microviridae sp.]
MSVRVVFCSFFCIFWFCFKFKDCCYTVVIVESSKFVGVFHF